MRADTRERILEIAERLVMQRGYHAFSYQHIAEELGVRAAAIHYHYRTKPDLVTAVLDRYRDRFHRWADRLADQPPRIQLDAYLDLSRGFLAADRVCALGMMAADFNVVPGEVGAEIQALQAEIFAWFAAVLRAGRDQGVFTFAGDVADKASEVACTMLGSQLLGRVNGPGAFEAVARQVRLSVGLVDPPARPPPPGPTLGA